MLEMQPIPLDPDAVYGPGTYWVCGASIDDLIVGEALDSPYPEDMQSIREGRKAGYIYGAWYSKGTFGTHELGDNHVTQCERITEDMFLSVLSSLGCERYKPGSLIGGEI